jgi:hypothetical protein
MMGPRMSMVTALAVLLLLVLLGGCKAPGGASSNTPAVMNGRVFLTVDFEAGKTLRYKFVSERNIAIDWDPGAASSPNRVQEQTERLEMVTAYTPVEVDRYGASTIRAVVESVKVTRSSGPGARAFGPDAVESAQGRSFVLQVDPRGRLVDSSQLEALIKELGAKAFRRDQSRGRVKEPDMIGDFVAGQWFLWDAVASVARPAEGVAAGQRWSSQLSVPTPMVMRKARDVQYRLEKIRPGDSGPVAVIKSTYAPAASAPADWPVPYAGRFQMAGTFGFLGPYEVQGLTGSGEELFNVEAGRTDWQRQKYTLRIAAALPPMGIRANPHITIDQILTTEFVESEIQNSKPEIRNNSE